MKKLICWALFDSETGDYTSTVHKFFEDKIDVYGVGISHYGKNTDHYLNFDLSDFTELFGGENIGKKLLKVLPKPDIIVASPPCESWSHMTSINNGNIHWKRYASKLFPENKVFQLQDVDVQTGFVKNNGIKTFYTRVNGELCHQNTWEIIKVTKPKVFMVENPDNYSWEYIQKYVAGGGPDTLYEQAGLFSLRAKAFFTKTRDIWFQYKIKVTRFFNREKWEQYQKFLRYKWLYFKGLWDAIQNTRVSFKRLFRPSNCLYWERVMRIKLPAEIEDLEDGPHKRDLIRHYKKGLLQNAEN